jgi:chemotaxis protein methyltransferase CheR
MSRAASISAAPRALVEGEYLFTAGDFQRIAALAYDLSGIVLNESKATLVYSRLAKRLRALGLQSFRDYWTLVGDRADADERGRMVTALTTNLTRFLREPHHFEDLKAKVVLPLAAAVRAGRRLRIWSAACSTGQEPYSAAMAVLEVMPDAANHDVRILATDIDAEVTASARRGVYPLDLGRDIPPASRSRWFKPASDGRHLEAGPELKALVTVRQLNLIGDWPMPGAFDAVFCRNVAIYFDEPTQERLWSRLASKLTSGGRLYAGHSERVSFPQMALEPDGLTTYAAPGRLR